MSRVRKAVITAAGIGTRHFPATQTLQKELMPLVDRDGTTKPTIQIILEEAVAAGIEEVCLVVSPHNQQSFRQHFCGISEEQTRFFRSKPWALEEAARLQALSRRLTFALQPSPEGYGHAVHCAREFVGDDPFLLLLGDHVFIPGGEIPCSRQAMDVYEAHRCPVSGVQRTTEELLHLFGTLRGAPVPGDERVYEVEHIAEKPSLEYAEEHLRTVGLRRDEYLCFFGMHVFPAAVFEKIGYLIRHNERQNGEIQLTPALDMLRAEGRYLAAEVDGARYDMGVPLGYIQTQIALALHSPARRQVRAAFLASES